MIYFIKGSKVILLLITNFKYISEMATNSIVNNNTLLKTIPEFTLTFRKNFNGYSDFFSDKLLQIF